MNDLYPHNRRAVEAVKKGFETEGRVAVVHPTGTGKAWVAAAVANDFEKCVVIAPNTFVLNEARKVCKRGVEFRTYASFMYDETPPTDYDLIVLDEFHRVGAEKWGEGVQRLLAMNPNAKVLGTSATPIRYLDNMRNIAEEVFNGKVVSFMTLKNAIDEGILPSPIYVSSIYTMRDTISKYQRRIGYSRRIDNERKELSRRLYGIADNWENAHGVPSIIRKYFTKDMQRVIVFCSSVQRAKSARGLLRGWLRKAGYKRVRFYNIDYTEAQLESEMAHFQEPLGNYDLKVAVSVNMLNEGVHVPHVDGIIMLRSTISRIIIEQQVGRCLTADKGAQTPIVLDLVNNMDLVRYDNCFFTPNRVEGSVAQTDGKEKDNDFPFDVIDECRDLRIMLQQLDSELAVHVWTLEECRAEALKYETRTDFQRNSPRAYDACVRKGWLEEVCAHMRELHHSWTKEECMSLASECATRAEFTEKHANAYRYALRKGWLDEVCQHMKVCRHHFTIEECKEVASTYKSRSEFKNSDSQIYNACIRYGWLDDVCAHMEAKLEKWTFEKCQAKAREYNKIADLRKAYPNVYSAIARNGWQEECFAHMAKQKVITREECLASALKYKHKVDWNRAENRYASAAMRNGWYDECCAHMVVKPRGKSAKVNEG